MILQPLGHKGPPLVELEPTKIKPDEFIVKVVLSPNGKPFVRIYSRRRTFDYETNQMSIFADLQKRLAGASFGYYYASKEMFVSSSHLELGREAAGQTW